MDCIVRGVAKSQTQLSDFHFHLVFIFSVPWTEEPGGLQSMGSLVAQRLKHLPATWETWV